MTAISRYHLGFNWSTSRDNLFTRTVADEARRRGLTWLCVLRADTTRIRRRVSDNQLKCGLFLNTQADGSSLDSPLMLLNRSLKASGCFVVEDPDDAPIYANRGLQLDYLERAGLPVPQRCVIQDWKPNKPVLTASQHAQLGGSWFAQPAIGMDCGKTLFGTGKLSSRILARHGFKPRHGLLVYRNHLPPFAEPSQIRFRVWYFFGHIVPCEYVNERSVYELLGKNSAGIDRLPQLVKMVNEIAQITGLDWFVTEFMGTPLTDDRDLLIVEPANALAHFGPGVRALPEVPAEVTCISAQRLVEVAWRHARHLALADGITVRLGCHA
jgi:hypothetical protein